MERILQMFCDKHKIYTTLQLHVTIIKNEIVKTKNILIKSKYY